MEAEIQIKKEKEEKKIDIIAARSGYAVVAGELMDGGKYTITPAPHLVELLRDRNCTATPGPPDRRRSKMRGRISPALPLRRLREPSREPRRRLWSKRTFSR